MRAGKAVLGGESFEWAVWIVFHHSQAMTFVNEFLNGNTLEGSSILLDEFHHLAYSFLVTAIVPGLA